ncbi:unnamed protein product [Nezara viridula]|uniref:Uncharacterized protein n=1 Tax=Nezara viridula TaxID=85310 RepID=A0A9P0EIA8_NEZVI|nr:unnamed protein product [Nezara viridula]
MYYLSAFSYRADRPLAPQGGHRPPAEVRAAEEIQSTGPDGQVCSEHNPLKAPSFQSKQSIASFLFSFTNRFLRFFI